jgi:spermidine synthase
VTEVLARVEGRSGELVLRRRAGHLEVIVNGAFLISTENEASSRALVTAGLDAMDGDELAVLIGGLGLGYALDEALVSPRVAAVTVAEFEPAVVEWFRAHGGARAARAEEQARAGRATVVVADMADELRSADGHFDLVCLDTDNGPEWLVREGNAGLYDEAGVRLAHDALRPGGAAVFWSPARYPEFEERLRARFGDVTAAGAHDVVAGRRHDYVMYVARRVD